jgi:uncharacterized delta-60 repeat protein
MRLPPWIRRPAAVAASVFALVQGAAVPAAVTDGELDPAFGTEGRVSTLFSGGSFARAVAVQPDGKIVAVGAAAGPSVTGEFAVARYEPDGSLDLGFDDDGLVTTAIAGGGDEARSVAIQPDGKIVVAGTDSRLRVAVVRYLTDGSLDPGFGGDGIVRSDLTPGEDIGYDLAIQADGRIVVAGSAGTGAWFAVLRYRQSGQLDPSFGDGGSVLLARGGTARSLALQPDGRIVVTGYDGWGLVVARLRPDGSPDATFGRNGIVDRAVTEILPLAVAIQSNGRIVVAGDYDIFRVGIARFTRTGRLDTSFHHDGVRSLRFGDGEKAFTGLAIQPDGRIIAAGHAGPHEYGDPVVPRILIARFERDGGLDGTWGGDGRVSTTFPGGAAAHGLALQPDGKPIVAGEAGEGDTWGFAIARYLA